jgi:LytS/YehU family sensor histidine kinase
MLDRLISFLRATLGASTAREHALATEFERLEDYLALMKVRMGPRLQTALELPEELRNAVVPTLLLQPVVENAIKHGLEPQVEGGRIEIAARADGSARLVITVRDTGLGLGTAAQPSGAAEPADLAAHGSSRDGTALTGFGTGLVQQRLATLYGADAIAQLAPGPDGRGALVTIVLPLRAA